MQCHDIHLDNMASNQIGIGTVNGVFGGIDRHLLHQQQYIADNGKHFRHMHDSADADKFFASLGRPEHLVSCCFVRHHLSGWIHCPAHINSSFMPAADGKALLRQQHTAEQVSSTGPVTISESEDPKMTHKHWIGKCAISYGLPEEAMPVQLRFQGNIELCYSLASTILSSENPFGCNAGCISASLSICAKEGEGINGVRLA